MSEFLYHDTYYCYKCLKYEVIAYFSLTYFCGHLVHINKLILLLFILGKIFYQDFVLD
jgi:hypothetical protein